MTVQPIFEQTETRYKTAFTAQSIVECRAFSSADEVKSILAVTARAETVGCETLDKEIRYSGKVVYHLVWLDGNDRLQKTEVGAEFSHKATHEALTPSCEASVDVTLERTEVRTVNGSLVVTSVAIARVEISCVQSVEYLTGGEGIVVRSESASLYAPTTCTAQMNISDEWEISRTTGDVLLPTVKAEAYSVGAGIGYVVADGEVCVFLLATDENGVLFSDSHRIACRMEAEAEGVMPGMAADARYDVKNVKINAAVDADKNTTLISFEAVCCMRAEAAVEKECSRVVDAYCPSRHMTAHRSEIRQTIPEQSVAAEHRLIGRVGAEGVTAADAVIATHPTGVSCAVTQVGGGYAQIEGVISATAFLQGEGITAANVELPFSVKVAVESSMEAAVRANVLSVSCRTVGDGEVEMAAEIKTVLTTSRVIAVPVLGEVEIGEPKPVSTAAISVCYPRAGSTLWDVAKELGVSPEQVAAFNTEYEFPLTGDERIVVYRRLDAEE